MCIRIYVYTRLPCIYTERHEEETAGLGARTKRGRDPVRILLAEPYPESSLRAVLSRDKSASNDRSSLISIIFFPFSLFHEPNSFHVYYFLYISNLTRIVDNALNLLKLVKFFEMLFVKLISNFDRFRFFSNLEKLDSRHEDD